MYTKNTTAFGLGKKCSDDCGSNNRWISNLILLAYDFLSIFNRSAQIWLFCEANFNLANSDDILVLWTEDDLFTLLSRLDQCPRFPSFALLTIWKFLFDVAKLTSHRNVNVSSSFFLPSLMLPTLYRRWKQHYTTPSAHRKYLYLCLSCPLLTWLEKLALDIL
jgi:hypothetical protein